MGRAKKEVAPLRSFGELLQRKRVDAGFEKQYEAAKKLDVSQGVLSLYETGQVDNPDPEILRKMAEHYKVPYPDLVSPLCEEKYGVKPPIETSAGTVCPSSLDVMTWLREHACDFSEGWFVFSKCSHVTFPFYEMVRGFVKQKKHLRYWVEDRDAIAELKGKLASDNELRGIDVDQFIHLPDVPTDLLDSFVWHINQAFFFAGEPFNPENLVGYFTLRDDAGVTGLIVKMTESQAKQQFEKVRRYLWKDESPKRTAKKRGARSKRNRQ